ncbi:hypothetical protein [Ferrigenium sp. UT5]|uniref:hypothetical protein n=1 Tax=Ferrigenium sp. UT5 TaxID=3242105 RepID=UPI0038B4175F
MLLGACVLAGHGAAWAQEDLALDLSTPAQVYAQHSQPLMVAANDGVLTKKQQAAAPAAQPEFDPPWLTGSNTHLVLGLATVTAAIATALTPPSSGTVPRNTDGTHATLARATGILALSTVTSGFITHWDDFHLEDGWSDPDNLHMMLGVTGAGLMAYGITKSVRSSTKTSHAAIAELGAAAMIVGIKLTW